MTNYTETELLGAIFGQAAQTLEPQVIEHLAPEIIDRTGMVLRLLGLADESDEDFGWALNSRFMHLIAEQLARSSQKGGTIKAPKFDRTTDCLCNVLMLIGLLQKVEDGEFKPTLRLKNLVVKRLAELAAREKKKEGNEKDA
jgi:hypothetical protein